MFDLTDTLVVNGQVIFEAINPGDPAPQGLKFERWLELCQGPDGWKYRAAELRRPGKINYNDGAPEIEHPSWKKPDGASSWVPPKLVACGTGAQSSTQAWTAIKFREAGIDPGQQTAAGHTRRRLPLWDLDVSDHHLEGLVIIGPSKGLKPGELRAGTTPGECVGLYRPKGGMVRDVAVHGCFAGEEWVNDHQWSVDIDHRGNFCAIHWATNRLPGRGGLGDQHIIGKNYLTDQRGASFLVHPYAGIYNLRLEGGHAGMSPYWILGYDPSDPNFPIFGGDEVLDEDLFRALFDGIYLRGLSREAESGLVYCMLGRNGKGLEADPQNESGTFTKNASAGWYWPQLPVRAGIDVGELDGLEARWQAPLVGAFVDPVTGQRPPAIRARSVKHVRTADAGSWLPTLKAGKGRFVELVPGLSMGERPWVRGVTIGGLHGGDTVEIRVGRGTCEAGELVQKREWGEVQRHDGTTDHGCCGVNLVPGSGDGEAWHYATEILDHRVPVKVWHPEDADALHPDDPWPPGTLLKPSTEAPGCATKAEGWGDGQVFAILREEAPVGTTLPDCTIELDY